MKQVCKQHPRLSFTFTKINKEKILREYLKLETSKACQDADVLTKVIKESMDIFADVLLFQALMILSKNIILHLP